MREGVDKRNELTGTNACRGLVGIGVEVLGGMCSALTDSQSLRKMCNALTGLTKASLGNLGKSAATRNPDLQAIGSWARQV